MLTCGTPETQQGLLRLLCPCRTRCFADEVWAAICRAYDSPESAPRVRDQAFHALETLVDRARTDARWKEMLTHLKEQGLLALPLEKPLPTTKKPTAAKKREPKVRSWDLPRLLATLECGDPQEQKDTLRSLCPCRNPRYDQEVWLAIFRAYECEENVLVRDQAFHAIDTLFKRARIDPRSQELLRWLADQGVVPQTLDGVIPEWQPVGRGGLNGLYIPRYERSPRSKANRRR